MRALPLLLLVLAAGCGTPEPEAPAVDPAVAKAAFYEVMHQRLAALQTMHVAVIHADLPKAAAAAESVGSTALDETLPPAWISAARELESGVAAVRSAKTLLDAAVGTSRVAAACSSCHAAAGANVAFEEPPHPTRETGIREHMARHGTAAQAMYQGLVANIDGQWAQGVSFLAQGPLEPAELPDGSVMDERAIGFESHVHGLAATAQTANTRAERTQVLAELLTACATCHAHTRPLIRAGAKDGAPAAGADDVKKGAE